MPKKLDKLGRRIPQFDRSAAATKGAKTQKEKYGPDFHARNGADGGRARKRGYFGTLKDEGKSDELKALAAKGAAKSNEIQAPKRAKARRQKNTVRGPKAQARPKTTGAPRRNVTRGNSQK